MTYRDEAQQHLVAELRKVPQYNEIYIEKDFNGFTRPYFNLHEKLDLLEGIVNKAKSIDVNAALPLYLDDFTDFDNCKPKFQNQYLDLYVFLNKEYPNLDFLQRDLGFQDRLKIKYICIESFIKDIQFYGLQFLNEVDIVAENIENAHGIFKKCPNLKKIRGRINSKDKVMGGLHELFAHSFTSVENPDLSNFECYFIGGLETFYGSGISDPGFFKNWVSLIQSEKSFAVCNKIKKLDNIVFPPGIISSIQDFYYCENLEEIIGNWDPINSNKKGFELPKASKFLFRECKNLK